MKTIVLITDGKPGHENISKGIIQQIQQYHKIDVVKVSAKLRSSIFKRILRFCLNRCSFWKRKRWFIALFYKDALLQSISSADLIISTGGSTSFLNIMLKYLLGVPNIYCSSLRGLNPEHFTKTVSLVSHGYKNEIVVNMAPLFFPDNQKAVLQFKEHYHICDEDIVWSILIGGRTKDYPFRKEDIEILLKNILFLAEKENAKLCITTSRRTAEDIEEGIEKIIRSYGKERVVKTVLYRRKPEKVMGVFLAVSNRIFVTEDSGSMITESVLSRKNVYTLKPKNSVPKGIYQNFIKKLTEEHLIVSVPIPDLSSRTLEKTCSVVKELPSQTVYSHIQDFFEGSNI